MNREVMLEGQQGLATVATRGVNLTGFLRQSCAFAAGETADVQTPVAAIRECDTQLLAHSNADRRAARADPGHNK